VWRWVAGLVVLCVVGCAAGGLFVTTTGAGREWIKGLAPRPAPVEVRLEEASRGRLVRSVNAPGSIEPRTKVQISAQVVARITELPFREGDFVRRGDVVVRLDARDLTANLESAQAQLRAEEARLQGAEAALVEAERELARIGALVASRDVAVAELDSAEAHYRRALSQRDATRHTIDHARALIARARKDVENAVIVAPFDGRIVRLNAEVGELVLVGTLNNPASVIMEIADLSVMLMKARLDEANVGPVREGQPARITINAFPGRTFSGRVDRVGLKRLTDRDGTGYFEVEIVVDQGQDEVLRSGLTANVDIEVQTFEDVLRIPSQAVVERPWDELPPDAQRSPWVDRVRRFTRVVFVERDGVARAVPVSVGASDLTHTIILGGLEPGQLVVTGPYSALVDLKDGASIRPRADGPGPRGAEASGANGAGMSTGGLLGPGLRIGR
jgi:HlyD family secretion protein